MPNIIKNHAIYACNNLTSFPLTYISIKCIGTIQHAMYFGKFSRIPLTNFSANRIRRRQDNINRFPKSQQLNLILYVYCTTIRPLDRRNLYVPIQHSILLCTFSKNHIIRKLTVRGMCVYAMCELLLNFKATNPDNALSYYYLSYA